MGYENPSIPPSPENNRISILTYPNGLPYVELNTGTDTYTIILRGGEPFISSSTGTTDFNKLSDKQQQLVRKALNG